MPPAGLAAPPLCAPPNRDGVPVAGVELVPPGVPKEKDGVPPLGLLPKRPPEAGALVDGLLWALEEGVELGFPKLNDMVQERGEGPPCAGYQGASRQGAWPGMVITASEVDSLSLGWQTNRGKRLPQRAGIAQAAGKTAVVRSALLLTERAMMSCCVVSGCCGLRSELASLQSLDNEFSAGQPEA